MSHVEIKNTEEKNESLIGVYIYDVLYCVFYRNLFLSLNSAEELLKARCLRLVKSGD